MEKSKTHIFLIEDNDGDVFLTKKAFETLRNPYMISVANDGDVAIQRLAELVKEGNRPHLILLDINLPGRDGKQVLADIKSNPEYKRIPVIVLSSSSADFDISQVYNDQANAYLCKPETISDFRKMVTAIEVFWLDQCLLSKA